MSAAVLQTTQLALCRKASLLHCKLCDQRGQTYCASRCLHACCVVCRVGCGRLPGRQAPGLPAAPRSAFAVSHSAPKHVTAAVALAKKKCDRRNLGVQEDYPATAISVGYNGRDSKDYYERPSSSPASVIQQAAVSRDLDADVTRSPADVATANRQATSAPRGRTKPPSSDRHSRSKSIDRILCSSVSDVTCLGTGGQKWSFGPPGGVEKGRARRR